LKKKKSYFISANQFRLKGVKIGPLPRGKKIQLKICNFINNNFKIKENELVEYIHCNDSYNGSTEYELAFNPELTIHSDIKITFKGVVNFYIWVNLWYSSWENIKLFYDKACNNPEEEDKKFTTKELKEIKEQQEMIDNEIDSKIKNNESKPKFILNPEGLRNLTSSSLPRTCGCVEEIGVPLIVPSDSITMLETSLGIFTPNE